MRLPDWRPRLMAFLSETSHSHFEPGQHDCVLLAASARLALTGHDPMADWRGKYSSVAEGLALAQQHGCDDPIAWIVTGLEEIAPSMAQVGDIALLDGDNGTPALGVFQGEFVYALSPRRGYRLALLSDVRKAWRV